MLYGLGGQQTLISAVRLAKYANECLNVSVVLRCPQAQAVLHHCVSSASSCWSNLHKPVLLGKLTVGQLVMKPLTSDVVLNAVHRLSAASHKLNVHFVELPFTSTTELNKICVFVEDVTTDYFKTLYFSGASVSPTSQVRAYAMLVSRIAR